MWVGSEPSVLIILSLVSTQLPTTWIIILSMIKRTGTILQQYDLKPSVLLAPCHNTMWVRSEPSVLIILSQVSTQITTAFGSLFDRTYYTTAV